MDLADDNEGILSSLHQYFSAKNYEVVSIPDGLDGLKLLEAKRQLDSDKPKKYIQDTGTFNFN